MGILAPHVQAHGSEQQTRQDRSVEAVRERLLVNTRIYYFLASQVQLFTVFIGVKVTRTKSRSVRCSLSTSDLDSSGGCFILQVEKKPSTAVL